MTIRIFQTAFLCFFSFAMLSAQWTSSGGVTYTTNINDKVGIGTNSPGAKPEIKNGSILLNGAGYSDPALKFSDGTNYDKWTVGMDDASHPAGNDAFFFKYHDSAINEEHVVITRTGQVGIGVKSNDPNNNLFADADFKLSVNGKIAAEELQIQLSETWPDYVFQSGYNLLSLEEVEAHIRTNGHLPNIPSATEVEASGIAVGDMQRRMMEKIEELTLYLIEQDKQIKALKEELSELKGE